MNEAAYVLNRPVHVAGSELPPPVITYLVDGPDGNRWRLEADYIYRDPSQRIQVPEGFTFDLASVPRLLWPVIAPFELSIAAPLLHDVLYRHGGALPALWVRPRRTWARKEADVLFREIMEREGVSWWRRWSAYLAVRGFGSGSWDTRTAPAVATPE